MTPEQETFINEVLADAHVAAGHLNIPVSPILAQWINETGSGTSRAWLAGNNYAGVSGMEGVQTQLGAHLGGEGAILFYPNRQAGLQGYITRWADGVYDNTRDAWRTNPDAHAVAAAIEASPWAAGHYGGNGLRALIDELNLTQFDGGAPPVHEPGETPETPCAGLRPGPAPEGHSTLKVGATGDEVREVQLRLIDHGITPLNTVTKAGKVDGIFGPETAYAVAEFQTRNGLHRDGIVGRQTWCALGVR